MNVQAAARRNNKHNRPVALKEANRGHTHQKDDDSCLICPSLKAYQPCRLSPIPCRFHPLELDRHYYTSLPSAPSQRGVLGGLGLLVCDRPRGHASLTRLARLYLPRFPACQGVEPGLGVTHDGVGSTSAASKCLGETWHTSVTPSGWPRRRRRPLVHSSLRTQIRCISFFPSPTILRPSSPFHPPPLYFSRTCLWQSQRDGLSHNVSFPEHAATTIRVLCCVYFITTQTPGLSVSVY